MYMYFVLLSFFLSFFVGRRSVGRSQQSQSQSDHSTKQVKSSQVIFSTRLGGGGGPGAVAGDVSGGKEEGLASINGDMGEKGRERRREEAKREEDQGTLKDLKRGHTCKRFTTAA
ncbi:hypothetical protein C8R43DRAFT_503616 [Mycena crocata]|nr:hypothetical protein C8R43DRAFT_503616 [Mycena crocata]